MAEPLSSSQAQTQEPPPVLARRLRVFDATMLVMGGTIGSGIFMNPALVARQIHTPVLVLGAWILGGLIALTGAFIYAEISSRLPRVGGQYAYLREAFHPLVAFLYGWVLLLVVQTGGMAAVAVTFARYFIELTGVQMPVSLIAAVTLTMLTVVNCLGVKNGSNLQSTLMIMKIGAIGLLVVVGAFLVRAHHFSFTPILDQPVSAGRNSS